MRVSPSKPEVSAGEQTAQDKQLSDSGRVHKTVGSMAINGGPLAIGGRSTQDAMILRPEQNLTDAEVMLKVKAGDDAAFGYLIQKYRRPMVNSIDPAQHTRRAQSSLPGCTGSPPTWR